MATKGKLEGLIQVPTGGIALDFNDGSAQTATIAAGDYYLSSSDSTANDFLEAVQSAMNAETADTISITAGLGEAGDGRCTISTDGGTLSITWDADSNPVRDILGFETDGNLSGATSYQGTDHVRGCWLPDTQVRSKYGNDIAGEYVSSSRGQAAPDGTFRAITGAKRTENELTWPLIAGAKARVAYENRSNESWERFWLDFIQGEQDLAGAPSKIRWHPDADTDGTYFTYSAAGSLQRLGLEQGRDGWIGRWALVIPQLVQVG